MKRHDPYKTAEELGITEVERAGLIAVARDLYRDDYACELSHDAEVFDMRNACQCICGKLDRHLRRCGSWSKKHPEELRKLYTGVSPYWEENPIYEISVNTPKNASEAIYKFLTQAA